ncbi:hypothetical protein FIM70_05810 [Helicobacter pylori]|nr:hypothetical protein FIM70_05810 [Helicobacter pylori]
MAKVFNIKPLSHEKCNIFNLSLQINCSKNTLLNIKQKTLESKPKFESYRLEVFFFLQFLSMSKSHAFCMYSSAFCVSFSTPNPYR